MFHNIIYKETQNLKREIFNTSTQLRFTFECSGCMRVTVTALHLTAFFDSQKKPGGKAQESLGQWETFFPSTMGPPATATEPMAARNHS